MTGDQIRASFIQFFEGKGHLPMPSASLIPAGDPTLLFTTAGMVPFKPFFMGEQTPPSRRLTSVQKSFRTTDVDQVGDHKHLTFFEMLGNFSIGDYFKKEAISFAWELATQVFRLAPERLYVTIHLEDDEAFQIWRDQIGIPVDRIYRYGDQENWWGPAGNEGPCGPCSEIHYDWGDEKGCGPLLATEFLTGIVRREGAGGKRMPIPGCHPNCDCERFVEMWNLVFMQYYQDPQGNRTSLPAPSVDTGMGLERATAILQNQANIYETDLLRPIVNRVCELTGKSYGVDREADYAIRVVAEHARAASFLIGDGVAPGNEGRGYVLRRIIRRAIRYSRRLGLEEGSGLPSEAPSLAGKGPGVGFEPFLTRVAEVVLTRFQQTYPELLENHAFILKVIHLEEERFGLTIQTGLPLLEDQIIPQHKELDLSQITGEEAALLWHTYGIPPELTEEIARENSLSGLDWVGFERAMEVERQRSRAAHGFSGGMEMLHHFESLGLERSQFVGYDRQQQQSEVLAILVNNAPVAQVTQGQKVELVLRETPFYPEGGGQVGDRGTLTGAHGLMRVEDTQSPIAGLIVHRGTVEQGDISVGDTIMAGVEASHRLDASRHHSGTHLLHASLRSVLGPHVRQAGSLVGADRLRFDFSHVSPLSSQELLQVQNLANEKVRDNLKVSVREASYAQAVRDGALAFFGERYGDLVRIVEMSDGAPFSMEVCGGTHVHATGEVGALFVLGESGIGGGMRRIEAVTGRAAEDLFVHQVGRLEDLARKLQSPVADLEVRIDSLIQGAEKLRRRLAGLERVALRAEAQDLLARAVDVDGVKVVVARTSATSVEAMRDMGDFMRAKLSSGVVALGAVLDGTPSLITMVTADLVSRGLHAGNIARDAAKVMGGGGGGRPEMAQAGGRRADKLDKALQAVPQLVRCSLQQPEG